MIALLIVSLLVQIAAALMAVRLVRVTGRWLAWLLIASALGFMAVRRAITLQGVVAGGKQTDSSAEFVALAISALMLAGIAWIGPLFRAVRRAEEEVRQVLEAAPDAMIIADRQDRVALANAQALRLFGYTREEMMGMDVAALMPERYRARHTERRATFHERGRPRVLGTEAAVHGLRKDGTEFPAEVSVSPLLTPQGPVVVSTIRDGSERRMAEQALQASEARYRSLLDDVLDGSSVGVCILDEALHVVWVNRAYASFFGLRREEIIGRAAVPLARESLAPLLKEPQAFLDALLPSYASGAPASFECHVLAGEERWERWLAHWSRPIEAGLYRGGRIEQVVDVTERKQAELRLSQFLHIARDMQIGLVVYRLEASDDDRSLRIRVVNPEAERLLGIRADALLGKTIDQAFPHLRDQGIPRLLADVLRTGQAQNVEQFSYGDARVERGLWSFKAFPLPDQSVGVVFDRTGRAGGGA
ncbi:MAG: PAS domain S-box protein [Planctomycetaceae bacterium]